MIICWYLKPKEIIVKKSNREELIRIAAQKMKIANETPDEKKRRLNAATAARCAASRAKAKGLPPSSVRAAAVYAYSASIKNKKPA